MAMTKEAARSGKMTCPTCSHQRLLIKHHIHGRDIPEKNRMWNEAYICAGCHDEVHEGILVIEGWVMTTEGIRLAFHRAGEPQDCMEGAKPHLYSSNR